ncbi:hypothetical protein BD560DRAFT_417838 [Blakeslea trispora]|nr:hypothetical protein BD560DRAFT_417838 [Blakeslea trispora]
MQKQINQENTDAGCIDNALASNTRRLSEAQKKAFVDAYNKMENEKKWKIGEKCIEDIMFEVGSRMEYEHAAHSWIFDPLDEVYEEHLDDDDVEKLTEFDMPTNPEVKALLSKFASCRSAKDVDEMIRKSDYDMDKQFDLWWMIRTIQEMLLMFKSNKINLLDKEGSEADLVARLWCLFNPLFEFCGFNCTRPERATAATQRLTNNFSVTGTSRSQHFACSLPDLIITKDGYEYGCAEYGKEDKKHVNLEEAVEGSLKLPKEMKNLLVCLLSRVGKADIEKMKKVKTIGFLCNHFRMNCMIIDQPFGYACRLVKINEVSIPSKIEDMPAKFSRVLDVAWKMKEIARGVEGVLSAEDEEPSVVRKRKGRDLPLNVNNLKQFKREN